MLRIKSTVSLWALLCLVGVLCMATSALAESITATSSLRVDIPDDGDWVHSPITIGSAPEGAVVTGVDVTFSCIHTWSGDVDIDLNDDNFVGNYHLWENDGGSDDNPTKTVEGISVFNGLPVNGTWRLYAKDWAPGDEGYIQSWSITIHYSVPGPTFYFARIDSVSDTVDSDGDGYYEQYKFRILMDADVPSGSTEVAARIICENTGEAWRTNSWTITGTEMELMAVGFDETFFSTLTNPTNLDFTVQLWDADFTTLYEIVTDVGNEPFLVEPSLGTVISGRVATASGLGISEVTMNGLPGNPITDWNGFYTVVVPAGWSGTVTPTRQGCTFVSASRTYSNVTASQTQQNYTGTMSLAVARSSYEEGASVALDNLTVTAVLSMGMYVQTADRSAGIFVDTAGPASVKEGDVINLTGYIMASYGTGERFVATMTSGYVPTGERALSPLGLNNRALGGGSAGLQAGVEGGTGCNNIGQLVTVWGAITYFDTNCLYIDDGSGLDDGSGHTGIRCSRERLSFGSTLEVGQVIQVTGISSYYKDGRGKLRRLIK